MLDAGGSDAGWSRAFLEVRRIRRGDVQIVALAGELDLSTVAELDCALQWAAADDCRQIVLDLRELEFVDSSGLRAIFELHRRARGRLVVVRGPARVQRAFELCGLIDQLVFAVDSARPALLDDGAAAPAGGRAGIAALAAAKPADRAAGADVRRRAGQAVLAAAVRDLRSRGRSGAIR
jgi:anti-anti-sigma factor